MQKNFVEPNFQSKNILIMLCGRKNVKKFFITKGPGASTLMGESKKIHQRCLLLMQNSYKDDHTKNFKSTEN